MESVCCAEEKYYVYCLINKEWKTPFYVGKGSGNRCKDKKSRPAQIQSILSKYDCTWEIIVDRLSEENALIMEKYIKMAFKEMGYPIIDYERYGDASAQRAGIDAARSSGKHLGRPKAQKPDNWNEVIAQWKSGEITAVEAMRQTGLKRSTFYKLSTSG